MKVINVINRQGDFLIVDGEQSPVIHLEGKKYYREAPLDVVVENRPEELLDHKYVWFTKWEQTLMYRNYRKKNGITNSPQFSKLTLLEKYGIKQGENKLDYLKDIDPAQWSKEEQTSYKNAIVYKLNA